MPKTLIVAALAGAVSAAAFVAPLSGSLLGALVANFTHYPLFVVGLSLGAAAAAVAAAVATLVVSAAGGLVLTVAYLIVFAVPATVIARQALLWRTTAGGAVEWYPPGRVLGLLVGYGIAVFAAALVAASGHEGGLEGLVRATTAETLATIAPSMSDADRAASAAEWASLFPAVLVVSWLVTVVINAALAQATLVWRRRNQRPSLDLARVELPLAFAFVLAAGLAVWLFADGTAAFVGKTLTLIVAAPYLLLGVAVVHSVLRGRAGRVVFLILFYAVFLVVLGALGLALVAGLGLVEQLVGVRRRLAPPPDDKED